MCPKEVNEKNFGGAFDPDDLKLLDLAYQSAWTKLKLRDPKRADALAGFLRHRVIQIAKCGVRDLNTLSDIALDMLPSQRREPSVIRKRSKAFAARSKQV